MRSRSQVGRPATWMALWVAAAALAAVGARALAAEAAETRVKLLGEIGTITNPDEVVVSPTGERVAWMTPESFTNGRSVWCDGVQGTKYQTVGGRYAKLTFSADGRLAYGAKPAGKPPVLVCDGKESSLCLENGFAFSPDGKHLACATLTDPRLMPAVMLDGKPMKERIAGGPPVFSPDSKRLAWTTFLGSHQNFVTCDDRRGPAFDRVGTPVFSSDSRHVAYAAGKADKWWVVCGTSQFGPYDEVADLRVSNEGRPAFRAREGKTWSVVLGDRKGPRFDEVGSPAMSKDGKHLAYAAVEKGEWSVVRDGVKSPAGGKVMELVLSADGRRLAWSFERDGQQFVSCDGKTGAGLDCVEGLAFTEDDARLVYVARTIEFKYRLVCEGVPFPLHTWVKIPARFADTPGKLRYVAIDSLTRMNDRHEAWLVEVERPVVD